LWCATPIVAIVTPPSLLAGIHGASRPGLSRPPHADVPEADAGGLAAEPVGVHSLFFRELLA
jgi:hypothetical protein